MGPRNIQVGDPVINLLSDAPVWPVVQKEWIVSPVDPAGCESLETSLLCLALTATLQK